jgi:hypothetical protein
LPDPLIALLRELIEDQSLNDISVNMNLVVVHHAANVSGHLAPEDGL